MQLWRLASLKSARWTSGLEAQGRADGAVQVQRLATAGFCLAQGRSFYLGHPPYGKQPALLKAHKVNVNLIKKLPYRIIQNIV